MRNRCALFVVVFCMIVWPAFAQPISEGRNIVFILVDDMRWDAMSCAGHPFLKTPNLDRLAAEGILFERAFVTTSLCSPSRASFLTGQYAHVHGVMDNNTNLDPKTPTFPIELQKAGYETALIGKWHMGGASDEPRPGFDRWVSFRGQGVYVDPTFNIDGEKVKREGYVTDLITDYAAEFISKERAKPFFLYVSHKAVHAEFTAAPRHAGSYANEIYPHPDSMADTDANYEGKPDWVRRQRMSWHGVDGMYNRKVKFDDFARDYAEAMRAVDDSVGRIMETLKSKGLLDSTLIIFTSDNGFQFGEHGLIDKRTMYEDSIRIPLIARCPELFKGGQRRREMVLNIDLAPTLLEAAGIAIPKTIQGKSYVPLMLGQQTEWRDAFLYEYFWERSFPQTPTVLGLRTDRYKLMQYHGIWDRNELYDLETDPHEMRNLIGKAMVDTEAGPTESVVESKTDPETTRIFKQMQKRLRDLLGETAAAQEPNWRQN